MTTQDYINRHEFLRPIVETQSIVDNLVEKLNLTIEFPSVEECKALTADGVPVLQHDEILDRLNPFEGDTDREIFKSIIRQEELDCDPMLRLIVWTMLERAVPEELKASETWATWRRNYCPICGRRPVMAQLRKEFQGRARFMLCDGCHTMWEYNRLGCVYCGNDDLKSIHILEIEAEPDIRLDVCDKCQAYLKTYNHEGEEQIYLNDRLTLHFDLLADDEHLIKHGSILTE
ncbi:MAG: formate dehydrogenase accessory protein FdhE [Selenomonadaceae bacterium]|nr:formate dehydrogenase accessory protein FdhE [Selenomonadaceae bacterium]